jgi:ABC-type antimicrobial peptide transport system permease subunit
VKNSALRAAPAPEIDVPFSQLPWPSMNLTVRSESDATRLAAPIRAIVASLDRDLPVTHVQSLEEVLSAARAQPRLIAVLLGLFSLASLVLACVGLYGLIAYSVGQRTQELGVRLALGASGADVVRLVVRHGVILAAAGIAVGLAASFAVTRWMAGLVYGIGTTDALTFVVSPVVFLVLATIASWVPARRAANVDPCDALRA